MADRQTADGIQATLAMVRAKITRFASRQGPNEQNTKGGDRPNSADERVDLIRTRLHKFYYREAG